MPSTVRSARSTTWINALLVLSMVIAISFIILFAWPYLIGTGDGIERYTPSGRFSWLLAHIGTAMVALLIGPAQIWMGLNRREMRTHRALGIVYISAIIISSFTAYYLSVTTTLGWIFGAGLAGLATAWLITTGLAYAAIWRRNFEQHKEWMIRSYVVTFAFVFFRMFVGATQAASVGPITESLIAASWFCWAIPLLITEAFLQGRKIF